VKKPKEIAEVKKSSPSKPKPIPKPIAQAEVKPAEAKPAATKPKAQDDDDC
jgi:hypothetical protein